MVESENVTEICFKNSKFSSLISKIRTLNKKGHNIWTDEGFFLN